MNKPAMLALLLTPAALFADPQVERVIVRQQWPWSTDVKVEYALSGVDASHPVNISVRAFNGDTELDSAALASAITGRLNLITSPVGSFMIDPVAAFETSEVALGNFRVRLLLSDAMEDVLYKIVDLDPPYTITNVKRKDFYNGTYQDFVTSYSDIYSTFTTSLPDVLIWRGVTNDVYKTDKMVFRRIPAAGKTFNMMNDSSKQVTFSKDFYIGVFEVTQSQFAKFHTHTSWETNALYTAKRPVTNLSQAKLRGNLSRWPANRTHTDVQNVNSFVGNMQKATGLRVDLPTEFMWEFACHAGTTTWLYTGNSDDTTSSAIHWLLCRARYRNRPDNAYSNVASTRNCTLSDCTAEVGTYLPNAFGLYDMIGNALELCLDRWSDSPAGGTDPVGNTSSGATDDHVARGGSANISYYNAHVGDREKRNYWFNTDSSHSNYADTGVRLCIWLGDNDDGEL